MQQHLTRRLRAAAFDEAQVPGGDLGVDREVELAHAAAPAPFAQMIADVVAAVAMAGR